MRNLFIFSLFLVSVLAMPAAGNDKLSLAENVEQLFLNYADRGDMWPGFDARAIPLAVYDGYQSWLFRHPSPPDGYLSGQMRTVYPGRLYAITANSSALVNGQLTATLIIPSETTGTAEEWAATALHEAFHVYQRQQYPHWSADESMAFTYPVDALEVLVDRRLESRALRLAQFANDDTDAACWARIALNHRRSRFLNLGKNHADYERINELNEGLARYIQQLSLGKQAAEIPEAGWHAEQVRLRLYESGAALAHLLDRFNPDWKQQLTSDATVTLEYLLDLSLTNETGTCGLTVEVINAIRRQARTDAANVVVQQQEFRAAFHASPGQQILIVTGNQPLWPEQFDPWNIQLLDGGDDLLHSRMLTLSNDNARIQLLNSVQSKVRMMTHPTGDHPIFQGIDRIEVSGLENLLIRQAEGQLTLTAEGFESRVPINSLDISSSPWTITLD